MKLAVVIVAAAVAVSSVYAGHHQHHQHHHRGVGHRLRSHKKSTGGLHQPCHEGDVCDEGVCIRQSDHYAQCMPEHLERDALCGQDKPEEGMDWIHDACPDGYSCVHVGTDLRCREGGGDDEGQDGNGDGDWDDDQDQDQDQDQEQDQDQDQDQSDEESDEGEASSDGDEDDMEDDESGSDGSWEEGSAVGGEQVEVWDECTHGQTCVDSICVHHSEHYAQCKPEELPVNELCGQDDGNQIHWMYDYCPEGQSCMPVGQDSGDYRCADSSE